MRDKNRKIPLVAKVIAGIALLAVFILNIVLFVQKDEKTNDVSLTSLKAFAQTGENGGYDYQPVLTSYTCSWVYEPGEWFPRHDGCPEGSVPDVSGSYCIAQTNDVYYYGHVIDCYAGTQLCPMRWCEPE